MIFLSNHKAYIHHTDAGGIVYHANYLNFFENCRRDFLAKLGFGYFIHSEDAYIHFVVTQANIQYHHALWLDDEFIASIDALDIKPASLIFHQSIIKDDVILVSAIITLVCVKNFNNQIKPCRIPLALLNHLKAQSS